MSVRGGYKCEIAGKRVHLLMTLGAMEEIEEGLGVGSINAVQPMLTSGNAKTIRVMLRAMSAAGADETKGFAPLSDSDIKALSIEEVLPPITEALRALSADADAGDDSEKKP